MTYTRLRITETRLGGTVPIALRRRLKVAEALSLSCCITLHTPNITFFFFVRLRETHGYWTFLFNYCYTFIVLFHFH